MSKLQTATRRRYSIPAIVLMIGVPVLMYVAFAAQTVEMRQALSQGATPNFADLAIGGGLFMLRWASMLLAVLSAFVAIFGSPKEFMPKWMVRK